MTPVTGEENWWILGVHIHYPAWFLRLQKNYGKIHPFLIGKPWENHGKMVIYMERSTHFLAG